MSKAKTLHAEISRVLNEFTNKCLSSVDEFSDANELHDHVLELNDMLSEEKAHYQVSTSIAQCNECNCVINPVLFTKYLPSNVFPYLLAFYLIGFARIS